MIADTDCSTSMPLMLVCVCDICDVCLVFGPVSAVGDIHGVDTLNYTKDEKVTRGKLASCYRLADIYSWSHGLDGYITVSHCSHASIGVYLFSVLLNEMMIRAFGSCDLCSAPMFVVCFDLHVSTTSILRPLFQDSLGKPAPER